MVVLLLLLSLCQVGTYNSMKTNKNQETRSSLQSYKKIKCKLTDYNFFLHKLVVPWCARYK